MSHPGAAAAILLVLLSGCARGSTSGSGNKPETSSAASGSNAPGAPPAASSGPTAAPANASAKSPSGQDLVFTGTVSEIAMMPAKAVPQKSWIVTVKIEKVLSGSFSGESFSFRIHSPVKSGLSKGRSYTIEAKWVGDGYVVDELQWMRPK